VLNLADNHVHSEWSWDAPAGDMQATCQRAVELGLTSIAFTEHMDWACGPEASFDVHAYFECIERCRAVYSDLRIMSGVEMGEPHRYPSEARAFLEGPFDRILGSVHCVDWEGRSVDASERGFLRRDNVHTVFRLYLAEVAALLNSGLPFQVLGHLDYPKRYWPVDCPYDEATYEGEFREILRLAARRDIVLEVNTTRGRDPGRALCPGLMALQWWRKEGGRAISFGSDAHSADELAGGFEHAREIAREAGFEREDRSTGFWLC
jgi:histidinol-phosphatase (PHP family)